MLLRLNPPAFGGNLKRLDGPFPFYRDANIPELQYALVFEGKDDTFTVPYKGQQLTVRVRNNLGQFNFAIEDLTLAELSDVAEAIRENPSPFTMRLAALGYTARLYSVRFESPATMSEFFTLLFGGLPPRQEGATTILRQRLEDFTSKPPAGVRSVALVDSRSVGLLSVDAASFARLEMGINGIVRGSAFQNPPTTATSTTDDAVANTLVAAGGVTPPVFSIDQPCLNFSVAPLISGAENSVATTFRFRRDIFSPEGRSYLKLRANGDGDISGSYFNRAEASAELGMNNLGLVKAAGGGAFSYAFSRHAGQVVDEWSAGGKLNLSLPPSLFATHAGSLVRPLLAIHGGAAGGRRTQPGTILTADQKSFLVQGTFTHTIRPTERLSLDLLGGMGASSEETFFNGRRYFSYGRAEIRFNLSAQYDFVARYDCGRRNPDYVKYCGWTTGITIIQGR